MSQKVLKRQISELFVGISLMAEKYVTSILNKPGPAQVGALLKFQKTKLLKEAKHTFVEILSVSLCRKVPKTAEDSKTTFPQKETQKKTFLDIFSNVFVGKKS